MWIECKERLMLQRRESRRFTECFGRREKAGGDVFRSCFWFRDSTWIPFVIVLFGLYRVAFHLTTTFFVICFARLLFVTSLHRHCEIDGAWLDMLNHDHKNHDRTWENRCVMMKHEATHSHQYSLNLFTRMKNHARS